MKVKRLKTQSAEFYETIICNNKLFSQKSKLIIIKI